MSPRPQLFAQPAFIAPFDDFRAFAGARIGLDGQRGVLGGLLQRRLLEQGVAVEAFNGDVTDAAELRAFTQGRRFDLFFHFAAIVPVTQVTADPARAFEVNAVGALRVAQAVQRENPDCWLFLASSSHVYRPQPAHTPRALRVDADEGPVGAYGRSKLAGETLWRQYLDTVGAAHCVARIFSFSHATQQEPYLVPSLLRAIREAPDGSPVPVINAASVRDITDAETVIDAVLHLAARRHRGLLNLGTGAGKTVGEVAAQLAHGLGRRVEVQPQARGAPDALVADVAELKRVLAGGAAP